VQSRDRKNIENLLDSPAVRQVLITDILTALRVRNAEGVNILFDSLPPGSSAKLNAFIRELAQTLKVRKGHDYNIGLRIPANAPAEYDLRTLNSYVDHFWVDFTAYRTGSGRPLAPLAGKNNDDLTSCISRYLKIPIPPAKLMVCLPYFGIRWDWRNGKWTNPKTIPYKNIKTDSAYRSFPTYDPLDATERLDITAKNGTLTRRIWYDDNISLGAKYDYIRRNGLGGIVIDTLGNDDGFGDLWDMMAAKLSYIDTTRTPLAIKQKAPPLLDDWQWSWAYVNAKLEQYSFIFSYPCETEFPKVLIHKWEKAKVRNNNRNLIRKEESAVLGVLSITIAILFIAGVLLFINRIRQVGDRWKGLKLLAGTLIFLFILLTISAFMFLFLDTTVVFFGASDDAVDCFDFPLGILFTVIFTGIAIGVLITRFLLFPLLKKDDIP
jgi:hypothetical protein